MRRVVLAGLIAVFITAASAALAAAGTVYVPITGPGVSQANYTIVLYDERGYVTSGSANIDRPKEIAFYNVPTGHAYWAKVTRNGSMPKTVTSAGSSYYWWYYVHFTTPQCYFAN